MNSKGQELSLTTIILAALGLIILVVLAAVFTGRIGGFGIGLGKIQEETQCRQACKSAMNSDVGSFKASCADVTKLLSSVPDPTVGGKRVCCCESP